MASYRPHNIWSYNVDSSAVRPVRYKRKGSTYYFDEFSITICNLRELTKEQRECMSEEQIRVDSTTPMGNPFHILKLPNGKPDENSRIDVVTKYRTYFQEVFNAFKKGGCGMERMTTWATNALSRFTREYSKTLTPRQVGYKFMSYFRHIFKTLAKESHIELWDWEAPHSGVPGVIIGWFIDHISLLRDYRDKLNSDTHSDSISLGGATIRYDAYANAYVLQTPLSSSTIATIPVSSLDTATEPPVRQSVDINRSDESSEWSEDSGYIIEDIISE